MNRRIGGIGLPETIENSFQIFRRNAGAGIDDGKAHSPIAAHERKAGFELGDQPDLVAMRERLGHVDRIVDQGLRAQGPGLIDIRPASILATSSRSSTRTSDPQTTIEDKQRLAAVLQTGLLGAIAGYSTPIYSTVSIGFGLRRWPKYTLLDF